MRDISIVLPLNKGKGYFQYINTIMTEQSISNTILRDASNYIQGYMRLISFILLY